MHISAKAGLVGAAAIVALGGWTWGERVLGVAHHDAPPAVEQSATASQALSQRTDVAEVKAGGKSDSADTYSEDEVVSAASGFFGDTAQAAGQAVARVFKEKGRPMGYIKGQEVSGAVGVGLRYGEGDLVLKNGQTRHVYWQGPSIGFDTGADAAKVFTLVYALHNPDDIYQRFPGVSGSAFFVGGVGVNYQKNDDTVLAPMRAGVGVRAGVNVGYLHYTRERKILPL